MFKYCEALDMYLSKNSKTILSCYSLVLYINYLVLYLIILAKALYFAIFHVNNYILPKFENKKS